MLITQSAPPTPTLLLKMMTQYARRPPIRVEDEKSPSCKDVDNSIDTFDSDSSSDSLDEDDDTAYGALFDARPSGNDRFVLPLLCERFAKATCGVSPTNATGR
jgi:hypothetical protein